MTTIKFNKIRTAKDYILATLFAVTGIVLIVAASQLYIGIIGVALFCTGVIIAFSAKSGYRHPETNDVFIFKTLYFNKSKKGDIIAALRASSPQKISADMRDESNSLRMELFYNRESDIAYCTVFEYIPYEYTQCTDQQIFKASDFNQLIK